MWVFDSSVKDKKPFRVTKSNQERFVVCCREESCTYKVSIRLHKDGLFHVVKYVPHSCQSIFPTIKTAWVRERSKQILLKSQKIDTRSLTNTLKDEDGVVVAKSTAYVGFCNARKSITKEGDGFEFLYGLLEKLAFENEGTVTGLVVNNGLFQRAFVCPGSTARAFRFSLKILAVDACHVRNKNGGVIHTATCLDGNGNVFPVAFGISESESEETWAWFFQLLEVALNEPNWDQVVFLSDREKGIESSLSKVIPAAKHGHCVFHIEKNVKTKFKTTLNGLLWRAAKCEGKDEFESVLREIESINMNAAAYVRNIPPETWARSHFTIRRYGHVTSNIGESMNEWIGDIRHLNPTQFFVEAVRKVNELFLRRRSMYPPSPRRCPKDRRRISE